MKKLKSLIFAIPLIFVLMGVGISVYAYINFYQPGPLEENKVIFIHKGMRFGEVLIKLQEMKAIDHLLPVEIMARMTGLSKRIQSGEFEIERASSPYKILSHFAKGQQVQHKLTIAEGLTVAEILKHISAAPLLDVSAFPEVQEGELLPETYQYTWNETAIKLISRMKEAMRKCLEDVWATRKETLYKDKNELLIMASIIEKETAIDAERAHIAGVFLNRLKRGMPLQSDPTVIYGLEKARGIDIQALSKSDLQVPTEFNTYLKQGLPPAPICSPGKASLEAAANPMETEDLYFVADGSGGHIFAKTYQEHAQNHRNWRKIRDNKE